MDQRLISWAAAVKSKVGGPIPPLWFFTDAARTPDPRATVAALPKGLCGVVLRHDHAPDRAALGRDLALLCRARHNLLVVAGDWKLAYQLRAGLHLRGGYMLRAAPGPRLITASAHNRAEFTRARAAKAAAIFVSPLFATPSHPGAPALGLIRALAVGGRADGSLFVLGGIGPADLPRLPVPRMHGIGGIGCFNP